MKINPEQAIHDYLFAPELVDSEPERWEEALEIADPILSQALATLPDVLIQDFGFDEGELPTAHEIEFKAILAENCENLSGETKARLEAKALELLEK